LFSIPELFNIIQESSGTGWKEMYQVFNMGHRLEIYTDKISAGKMIKVSQSLGIEAKIIGYCESHKGKKLTIKSTAGEFIY
jgi:phosphoribosylformylglycinamidine cyclo-ligase